MPVQGCTLPLPLPLPPPIFVEIITDLYRVTSQMHDIWGRGEVRTVFWCGHLRERDRLENPVVDGWKILKWICKI